MTERKPNISVQYTRLTHADRLPDRFLTSQIFTPADPESQREGMILSQIEILNPWFPTSQIGQTIINTVIREYYRATDTSELNNFETALKKVNETLAQVTQSGETDWIGNLHGILILINGEDLHISQTGQTQAYLFRGGKINHITEGLFDNSEPHPLRTFSNITSGTLQAGDRIVIANPLFFKTIDIDTVRDIACANPPALAAQEFANILKRNKAMAGEALVVEMATRQEAAALPLEYKTDTIYMDQGGMGSAWSNLRGGLSRVKMPVTSPAFSKMKTGIRGALAKADEKFDTHIKPHVQSAAKKTFGVAKSGTDKLMTKLIRGRASTLPAKTPEVVNKVKEKVQPLTQSITEKFDFGGGNSPQGKARKYGIWGAALLIVLIILILASRVQNRNTLGTTDSGLQDTITELSDKFNKVKLLSAYNDKKVAIAELTEIFDKLREIEETQELPPSLTELKKQAIEELGGLTNTKTIDNSETVARWGGRNTISGFKDYGFAINNLLATKVPGDENNDISGVNSIQAIAQDSESEKTYILGDSKMLSFDTKDRTFSDVKLSAGSWSPAVAFEYFNENLYFLDTADAKIVKYSPLETGYSEGEDYSTPEGSELKDGVDIAVNGSILVLMKNGNIIKYTSSGREAIEYSEMPSDGFISDPKALYANLDSNDVYILHKDKWVPELWRLTKVTRSGKYIESYFLPDAWENWQGFDFYFKDKVLWAITDSNIYKAKIGE